MSFLKYNIVQATPSLTPVDVSDATLEIARHGRTYQPRARHSAR